MSEALARERWAFLGRLPPPPNRVTLALAGGPDEDKAHRKVHGPFPHIDDEAFEVGWPAEYAGSSQRAEVIEMLLDELAGEPFPPWFEEEIDYQMGEDADPIERLPEGLASGHVLDIGDEAFVGE